MAAARRNPSLQRVLLEFVRGSVEYVGVPQGYAGVILILMAAGLCLQMDVTAGTSLPATWDQHQENMPTFARQISTHCQYPCKCLYSPNNCKAGVPMVRDGCDCCWMCARQHGDLCDTKDLCDKSKDLFCDEHIGSRKGICRPKVSKSCVCNGTTYRDGEEFKMNCNRLCICQNGTYTCSTTCPHEERPPSRVHCKNPILVKIEKQCCKEWVCPHSHSRPPPNETFPTMRPTPPCHREPAEWSQCSQSCGMGVSVRLTNDNKECQPVQERRLCFIRPCETEPDGHSQCKATWKVENATRFSYRGCKSVLKYMPRYCSTCKRKKCCGPKKVKTKKIVFQCQDGKRIAEDFMWIKKCDCFKARVCPFGRMIRRK